MKLKTILLLIAMTNLTNVACTKSSDTTSDSNKVTSESTDELSVSLSSSTVAPSGVITVDASGGTEPYTYSIKSGSGSISDEGLFTAPAFEGETVVSVYDADGNYVYAYISIEYSDEVTLTVSSSTSTILPESSLTFTASGGTSPYTFYMKSGSGSITTDGVYTASSSEGSATIIVYDADGSYAYGYVTISSTANDDNSIVYRLYNGIEHFYSTDSTEGTSVGYHYEQVAFTVLTTKETNTHPIYRCETKGLHFISTDIGCEGKTLEGLYGYIYTSQVSGTIPLYRFFKKKDHLITTNYSEGSSNGYAYESTLGYVSE